MVDEQLTTARACILVAVRFSISKIACNVEDAVHEAVRWRQSNGKDVT
jgi:hypothetical protein